MRFARRLPAVALLAFGSIATAQAPHLVRVFNDGDFAMVQLQAKPHQATAWSANLLGKYSLGVGKTAGVALPAGNCAYDLIATYDDGHKVQKFAVDACRGAPIDFGG